MKQRVSHKASQFTESVIREMTRLANKHRALNLAQGFPNFAAPHWLKKSACQAIERDINQYAITWGSPRFRHAIADHYQNQYDFPVDPETEVTVACGATEGMIAALLAVVDPGDRVVVFEPFYENYGPDTIIASADPIFMPFSWGSAGWALEPDRLEKTLQQHRVRALILNSPHNPTGKVFSGEELEQLALLAQKYDFYVLTDEIYEHIVFDGLAHLPMASLEGMRDRTITISGLSKTFSVTGWRLGYVIAPPNLSQAVRKMHDFLTVGAAAPLQEAGAEALRAGNDYYQKLKEDYRQRRDFLVARLAELGFGVAPPSGAYYVMADISRLTALDDVTFVRQLITQFGVATVPGSSFYRRPEDGRHFIRFAFCKTLELLEDAVHRLSRLAAG